MFDYGGNIFQNFKNNNNIDNSDNNINISQEMDTLNASMISNVYIENNDTKMNHENKQNLLRQIAHERQLGLNSDNFSDNMIEQQPQEQQQLNLHENQQNNVTNKDDNSVLSVNEQNSMIVNSQFETFDNDINDKITENNRKSVYPSIQQTFPNMMPLPRRLSVNIPLFFLLYFFQFQYVHYSNTVHSVMQV